MRRVSSLLLVAFVVLAACSDKPGHSEHLCYATGGTHPPPPCLPKSDPRLVGEGGLLPGGPGSCTREVTSDPEFNPNPQTNTPTCCYDARVEGGAC